MQYLFVIISVWKVIVISGRDEEKISKACYWAHEVYEACFAGCAEASCDNPRARPRPCYPYCEPGCVCAAPRVRDDRTHRCVLPQDCSPTQLGIPMPSPMQSKLPHQDGKEIADFNVPAVDYVSFPGGPRKPVDLSRMGNYFNIVIAPPPTKSVQPRQIVQDVHSPPTNDVDIKNK